MTPKITQLTADSLQVYRDIRLEGLKTDKASMHCGHIISLWVKPAFRGQGIAKALVHKLQEITPEHGIRKLSLHATTTQTNAIKLYEKIGFEKIAVLRESLYKDNRYLDEYLMVWHRPSRLKL